MANLVIRRSMGKGWVGDTVSVMVYETNRKLVDIHISSVRFNGSDIPRLDFAYSELKHINKNVEVFETLLLSLAELDVDSRR